MKITTYDELIQEAKNWSGRTDLTDDQYHSFTYFVGSMANQILRVAPMEWTTIIDVSPDGHVVIPPDFQELKSLTWQFNSEESVPLRRVSWDQYVNYRNTADASDVQARWFSRQGGYWFLAPMPEPGSQVTCHYFRTLPDINSIEQTNWLIQFSPLTYLFGTLHFLYLYVMDEERAAYWLEKMQGELTRIQMMYESSEYKGSTMSIQSPTNPGDINYGV